MWFSKRGTDRAGPISLAVVAASVASAALILSTDGRCLLRGWLLSIKVSNQLVINTSMLASYEQQDTPAPTLLYSPKSVSACIIAASFLLWEAVPEESRGATATIASELPDSWFSCLDMMSLVLVAEVISKVGSSLLLANALLYR